MTTRPPGKSRAQDRDPRQSAKRPAQRQPSTTTTTQVVPRSHDDPYSSVPESYSRFLGMINIDNPLTNGGPYSPAPTSFGGYLSQPTTSNAPRTGRERAQSHSRVPTAGRPSEPARTLAKHPEVGSRIDEVDDEYLAKLEDDEARFSAPTRAARPPFASINPARQSSTLLAHRPDPSPDSQPQSSQRGNPNYVDSAPSNRATKATSFPPTQSANMLIPVPDGPVEIALVKQNLSLLVTCQQDVQVLSTLFFAHIVEQDLETHVDVCARIEVALKSLRKSLTIRIQIGAEEWGVKSVSWHQKYGQRLLSLRTTLERLSRMKSLIESRPLRPHQRETILTKLEQHEAKLSDLASKYTAAFDRLRLCHLHFLLTQSHDEARIQLENQKLTPRPSFEKRWNQGKAIRAGLRNAYNDLKQEFYEKHQRPYDKPGLS